MVFLTALLFLRLYSVLKLKLRNLNFTQPTNKQSKAAKIEIQDLQAKHMHIKSSTRPTDPEQNEYI